MMSLRSARVLACSLLAGLASCAFSQSSGRFVHALSGPIANVNPMIGTGDDPDDGNNLYPGAVAPFGMAQLSPETEDRGLGYHHIQKWLKGFSMTHMSGVGCANEGEVFFTATTGPIVTQTNDYQTPYSHQRETAEAGYYAVQLLTRALHASPFQQASPATFLFPSAIRSTRPRVHRSA
jgi:putative alpha-1,2-mannosidase